MKLTLGFSPCPNDTFIFDALVHNKIDTEGLDFDIFLEDVERLNVWAIEGKLDVTKLSFNAFNYCFDDYLIIDCGSALGRNCGPILIKKPNTILSNDSKIAIPGRYTTASMLLETAYPKYHNKIETLFSDIENDVINNRVDAGLIIHENRFTKEEKGLEKVIDLGEFWESKTNLPIPLGGIVIKRDLPIDIQLKFERILRKSIEYAFKNRDSSVEYVKFHSQEMKKNIIDAHINLYVNKFSISLGFEGRKSIESFLKISVQKTDNIFLNDAR